MEHKFSDTNFNIAFHILRSFLLFSFLCSNSPNRALTALLLRFLNHTRLDTHTHKHTHDRNPLNQWWDRRRSRYLHDIQKTQQTEIHTVSGLWTYDPKNQVAVELHLWPYCHPNRRFAVLLS